jgi:hypothetical protein
VYEGEALSPQNPRELESGAAFSGYFSFVGGQKSVVRSQRSDFGHRTIGRRTHEIDDLGGII